jgi:hypothetical protein
VGLGDPTPDGTWRGWAALLAESLDLELHNLAEVGALTHTVVERQLPAALALRPAVAALHPSERGHRFLARGFAALLAARGLPVPCPPAAEPTNAPPGRVASVRWMATKGTRWVLDRSTDLVPFLVGMAVAEWWHDARGLAHDLDQHLGREAERVMTAVRDALPTDPTATPQSVRRGTLIAEKCP